MPVIFELANMKEPDRRVNETNPIARRYVVDFLQKIGQFLQIFL